MFKLVDKEEALAVKIIALNFDKLPENVRSLFPQLLFKIADDKEAIKKFVVSLASNFDKLPENVRSLFPQLLFKIADDKEGASEAAKVVNTIFDKLSEEIRNELLFKIFDSNERVQIVWTIVSNFDKLPENVRGLLFKIADEKGRNVHVVHFVVAEYFDKLPENVRGLLFKIADEKENAVGVAYAITDNFDKLPENVKDLFLRLVSDDDIAKELMDYVVLFPIYKKRKIFEYMSESFRDKKNIFLEWLEKELAEEHKNRYRVGKR